MEKSNNKGGFVAGVLVGIIIMLGVGIGLFATNTISFSKKCYVNTTNEDNKSNKEIEENNNTKEKNSRDEVVTKLKEVLTNDTWIKENLNYKKDCFGKDVSNANHKLSFEILTDDNSNPMVIVLDDADSDFIRAAFKIYYYNNEIKVKNIIDGSLHPGHAVFLVDKQQNLVIVEWGHMGDYSFTAYDVKSDEIKKYDEYVCSTGNCEYEYKGEKKYNITGIDKELTVYNINTYLK